MLDGLRRADVLVPVSVDFSRLPGGGASVPVPAAGLPAGSYVEVLSPVLLALAEAFRRGAELADDVRGLV